MTKPKYVVQQLWNEQAPGTVLTETQLRKLDANADIDQLVANGLLVLGSPDAASTPDSSDSTPPEDAAAAAASEPAAGKRKAEPQPTTVTNKKNGTITATVE